MAGDKLMKLYKVLAVLGIIAIGAAGMGLLGSADKKSNKKEVVNEARVVKVSDVAFGTHKLRVDGNGLVESQRTLKSVAEVSGTVLFAKNNLKDGTSVKEGEVIIEVDQRQVKNSLYSMRSEFMNSIASVLPDFKIEDQKIYDKWYNYFIGLKIDQAIPELPELTNSAEKIKLSSRNIYNKYFNVKNQEILLSKHTIKTPYDGYITNSNGIIEGSFVSTGRELFTITDVKNLEIAVPLLVEEVNLLELNTKPFVKITTDNSDAVMKGKVVRSETNLNRNSQTINVYVLFDNSRLNPYFLPGNYVHVNIEGKNYNDVALIPRHLINNEHNVYTMEEGKLDRKKVDIIAYQKDEALIKKTIPNHTKLVTTILQKPLIGMEIQVSENEQIADEIKDTSKQFAVSN